MTTRPDLVPRAQDQTLAPGSQQGAPLPGRHGPLTWVVIACAAIVLGALVAGQSRINGELGHRLADGYLAAIISFGVGLVLLSVGVVFTRHGRSAFGSLIDAVRTGSVPRWYFLGGVCGAILVLSQRDRKSVV